MKNCNCNEVYENRKCEMLENCQERAFDEIDKLAEILNTTQNEIVVMSKQKASDLCRLLYLCKTANLFGLYDINEKITDVITLLSDIFEF